MGIVLLLVVIALYIPLMMFAAPVFIYVVPMFVAGLIIYHLLHDHHPDPRG